MHRHSVAGPAAKVTYPCFGALRGRPVREMGEVGLEGDGCELVDGPHDNCRSVR